MAYEYEEFIDAMRFGLTMSDRDSSDDIWKMVDEVVNKAKAFDEILEMYEISEEYEDIKNVKMWQSPYEKYIEKIVKEYLEDE